MQEKYLLSDPWKIIEDQWNPAKHQGSESLFSLGNGHMGQRANFEEHYSGKHLQGSYVAGIYYPDKTRVGWWKNGYPEYFAKVLNSVNWIGINVEVAGEVLDLAKVAVRDFSRTLNMKEGTLHRSFIATMSDGKQLKVEALRFLSMTRKEIGAIRYSITPLNFTDEVRFVPYLDFDVINHDSNYDEKFWEAVSEHVGSQKAVLCAKTKKLDFHVAASMRYEFYKGEKHLTLYPETAKREKYAENSFAEKLEEGQTYHLYKYAAVVSSLNHPKDRLVAAADELASDAMSEGFDTLLDEQINDWAARWEKSDIIIEGDVEAQQGIRFNIFQLTQTYTGEDARLNIGPKGFTGEKYGGSTYWDTEAYCLPFYMASAGQEVARNLLVYRHNHLKKAIENAEKLGFTKGAALYPMVTMNGEECHNEWEITFEEIHRNGAIAFAIYNYIRYFGDQAYLAEYGLEVLIGIARFWAQRVNWSEARQKYVMLGVTGPNEYENNVNNNWYTSYIARWCLQYTAESIETVEQLHPSRLSEILTHTHFDRQTEVAKWQDIVARLYLPEDETLGIKLQQDNYLDKEQLTAADLDPKERPINQHWSWDRILRSCFIKQADVLQGMYLFEDHFDKETIQRNFDFYEPRTLHESSLSPCIHVITAAYLDKMDKAYELYLRTSRLDLDDYNHEVHEGLHITSMAGTWLSVVEGFGGMRVKNGALHFSPKLPEGWQKLSFKIAFGGTTLLCSFGKENSVRNLGNTEADVYINNTKVQLH
jgi:maltose phosphorylase